MANRSLEQMMLDEHKRLSRGSSAGGAKPAGLLDLARPATSAAAIPSPTKPKTTITQAAPASPASTFSKAAQTLAASAMNKGYTEPAPAAPPPAVSSSGGSVAGDVGKTALKVFTSGLGLMPLISGLAGLFGDGESAAPAPLVKYAMPRSIQLTAANSRDGGSLQFADYGQDGLGRPFGGTVVGSTSGARSAPPPGPTQSSDGASQIVVNVQAMDSRSFMDHSQEIAQAVRDAMLNMHALNDVVSEL